LRAKKRINKTYQVRTPSKFLSLEFLRDLQNSYYVTESGLEYDKLEVDALIYEKESKQVERIEKQVEKRVNHSDSFFYWSEAVRQEVDTCDKLDLLETISLAKLTLLAFKVKKGDRVNFYGINFSSEDLTNINSELKRRELCKG